MPCALTAHAAPKLACRAAPFLSWLVVAAAAHHRSMAANFPAVGRSHDYQQPPPAIIVGTHAHAASKVWRGGPGTGACVNQGEERVGVAS
ncbi:unnamed protein product [Urochloa humidicola]